MMLRAPRPAIELRRLRRVLVIAILIGTAVLASALPPSLHGFGLCAVVILTALDLVLVRSTRGLAFARGESLDERERSLRDRAYRVGFRWLGLAVVILMLVVVFSTIAAAVISNAIGVPQSYPGELSTGIAGRLLFAIIEVLCIVPTMVIAWDQLDGSDLADQGQARPRRRQKGLSLMWLVLPGMIALWLLNVTLVPVQAASRNQNFSSNVSVEGAKCRQFAGGRVVGGPFGATVGLEAEVCWNGTDAFVFNEPDDPALTACGAGNTDDFASVTTTCTASSDADGTLRYVVHGRVSALPFSIDARDITMTLAVARDGTVIEQP